jgi:mRNA-degrading endonuclease RelE of RelBE toxin-antitoxin system
MFSLAKHTPMAYVWCMIFIETPFFTEDLMEALPDDDYREFQVALAENPELGDLITGGGGLRKVRWNLPHKGKRGGVRIIYYWAVTKDSIYLLLIYKKTRQENIPPEQLAFLKHLVKGEFK